MASLTFELDKEPVWLIGSGAGLIANTPDGWTVDPGFVHIDPAAVATLAARDDPVRHPPKPLYLRAPDAAPAKSAALLFAGGEEK